MSHQYGTSCKYVVTTVTVYHAALVDIRPSRTVHSVDVLPCLLDPRTAGPVDCCAVHYGYCVPVIVRLEPGQYHSSPALHADLDHLTQKFATDNRTTGRSSPSSLMLALAAAANSNPQSPSGSSPNTRSLGSSAILSAVEKFERKTHQPQKTAASAAAAAAIKKDVGKTKTSSSAKEKGPVASAASSTAKSPMSLNAAPKDVAVPQSNAIDTSSTLPSQAKSTISKKEDPSPNGSKYNSSTWPSFQRTAAVQKTAKPSSPTTTTTTATTTTETVSKTSVKTGTVTSPEAKKTQKDAVAKSGDTKNQESLKSTVNNKKTENSLGKTLNNKHTQANEPSAKTKIKTDVHVQSKERRDTAPGSKNVKIKNDSPKKQTKQSSSSELNSTSTSSDNILQGELDKILKSQAMQPLTINTETTLKASDKLRSSDLGDTSLSPNPPSKLIENFVQSPIDFAKTRFQNVQNQKLLEEAKAKEVVKNGMPSLMVNETKSRFENGQIHNSYDKWKTEWLPSQALLTNNQEDEANMVQAAVDALKKDSRNQRMRKASSPEPNTGTSSSPLPHPRLTISQKQHIRERSLSPTGYNVHMPTRPFLTKGSVAERVLIFEKCPVLDREKPLLTTTTKFKQPLATTWKADLHAKTQAASERENRHHAFASPQSTLRRLSRTTQSVHIPRFYYPNGRPQTAAEIEVSLQQVAAAFPKESGKATKDQFGAISKACDLSLYWKLPLFVAAGGEKRGYVNCTDFLEYWKRVLSSCHDDSSKFVEILSRGNRSYIVPEDFVSLIQDVVNTHPGLTFLKEAIEFHSRYVHTVIARIYYGVNRSWSGQITAAELRKNNFLQVLALLEEEDDINQITEFFSYEHFYVIYCKFWELDKDHDLYIDKADLSRHNDHAISSRMIERIFSGAVTRGRSHKEQKMSYAEFVWFLISEEDKTHPTSIEYWFRCMDIDGDGFLSMYELEYFYEEQLQRMEALGIETLPFKDCLCQMLDMIRPHVPGMISLSDLKHCRMTPIFFDTFFNLEKYLDHEQKDPFASQRELDGEMAGVSDWDRFAADEYEFLVAEEGANAQQDDLAYDDEDELSPNLDKLVMGDYARRQHANINDDDYADYADYADSDDYQY